VYVTGQNAELTAGSPAPDFRLSASDGREVGLADFRSKSNVYLFFVREFN
jgi:peroxiredoxin